MKYLLFFCALLLASCARPNTPPPPKAEPIGLDSPIKLRLHADDSGYTPSQVVRRRVFGLLPPKKVATSSSSPLSGREGVPRKCKGCTFNLVAGNQTNNTAGKKATQAAGDGATATSVPKASAPVATASGDATDNTKAGQRGGAAATAPGATATATTTKPGFWAAALPGLGILAGIGAIWWVVAGGGGLWLAALWRKNKPNQA